MKDFKDPKWAELVQDFRKRVEEDKKYFNCWSVYVKLPEICPQPEYCLIGMEPGAGNDREKPEYRNFLASKGDFIINYCAYHYLGSEGFNYQITDMAKGSIEIENAKDTRPERCKIWLPLLKNELVLYGNPKIILIGKELYELNIKESYLSVPENNCIYHHSSANKNNVKKYYESIIGIEKYDAPANAKEKIEELAIELMEKHGYSDELKNNILSKEFKNEFTEHDKMLFAIYRYDFKRISEST